MEKTGEIKLARTLGLGSIILLGIGALLGGGIFTLIGPAAGLVGPGLFLSMILGAAVAFLNLQMYIALGTTFPEAGGGYLWVRKGLGNFQGFLAGWLSWFAHAAACGVYALSFGFYLHAFLQLLGINLGVGLGNEEKIFGVAVIAIFGYINWRGSKTSGKTGNVITVGLLAILGLFIIFGAVKVLISPQPLENYSPLLPSGFLGILAAVSFFYIAFEGSEIQVQAGEETTDPQKNIKRGLLSSWAIVSAIYILIAIVIVGVTNWQTIASYGEGAIARVAESFMPAGSFLMIIGGLFANIAALNATIYSSSRVSFALARDRNIWSRLANIHLTNLTPDFAVIVSTILISIMVVFFPLFDVASAASLLFVLLFLQLNLAGINIHYKWPDIKWYYKIPFFPVTPIIAVIIYAVLALTMLHVNVLAWAITAFWLLLGLVNYFAYAETKNREQFETGIVYEESVRIGPKIGKRILWPISPEIGWEEIKNTSEIVFALASKFDGEVVVIRAHEIPPAFALDPGILGEQVLEKERQLLNQLQGLANDFNKRTGPEIKDINFHGLIMLGRDVVDVILNVVRMEDCDVLLLNWGGFSQTQGTILSYRIDRLIRESHSDVLVIKNPKTPKKILLAAHPSGTTPHVELLSEITDGLRQYFQSQVELFSVIAPETPIYLKPDPNPLLKALNMKRKDFVEIKFHGSRSISDAIIKEAEGQQTDLIILGASWPRFLQESRFGKLSEFIAKNASTSVLMVKGHSGVVEVFWKNILKKLRPKIEKTKMIAEE